MPYEQLIDLFYRTKLENEVLVSKKDKIKHLIKITNKKKRH